jgi:UDP-N-acetylglucosamine--N-acetylmuramyl-(pentapeptide) pyrophosphoryl-undecaprenol N-acetylglucosamine transferase
MNLALTAGGTGGHIIPALAVLDAVRRRKPDGFDVRFYGPDNRGERAMVEAHRVEFERIDSAAVHKRQSVRGVLKTAALLLKGTSNATTKLRGFDADVVFSTGGYASFPACVAARLLRRPLVVFLPDVTPGWAVRVEKLLATRMATTTDAALRYLPKKKTSVTGYPVRGEFAMLDRVAAREALGIPADALVVLVTGATQGARVLNQAVFDCLETLTSRATVFHVTGSTDVDLATSLREGLDHEHRERYVVDAYRSDLPAVMISADIAVMRAGASTLGELPAAALPSILVPATYAGGHQRENARWLASRGAAVVLEESEIASLGDRLQELLTDTARLATMRAAASAVAQPQAADRIASIILEVARK